MANQEIHEPTNYSQEMRKLQTTDPSHADVFNPLFERLINNDVFLKSLTERLIQEHTHSGVDGEGSQIPLANIKMPVGEGKIVTDQELARHINERNPHGTRAGDVGAASSQEVTAHLAEKASATKLGHVMVGSGLIITPEGKLNVISEAPVSPIPSGLISMWSGAINTIPPDWVLCDGTKGTPNLIDRFIVGAGGAYTPGATGGADNVTLTTTQIPSHSHSSGTLSAASSGSHSHSSGTLSAASAGSHSHTSGTLSTSTDGSHSHAVRRNMLTVAGGSGATVSEMNPFGADTVSSNSNGAHSHTVSGSTASGGSHSHTISGTTASDGSHSHTISGSTATVGSGQSHENRPPYYALAYIMKI